VAGKLNVGRMGGLIERRFARLSLSGIGERFEYSLVEHHNAQLR